MSDEPGEDAHADAVAEVDALVAAIGPRCGPPVVTRLDAVLVTGPWLSGVSGVVSALAERLPEQRFVESADLSAGDAPTAVVFVVSAAAVLTGSDCALLDAASAQTDAVIAVVSKIDVHQNWDDVLAADRDVLAAHARRYQDVPWVGAAAAPEVGDPQLDALIAAVSELCADEGLPRRNRVRAWESLLHTVVDRYDRDADGAGRRARVEALREQRIAVLRQRRLAKSERMIALRSQTQQTRVQLSFFARDRCAAVRAELQDEAAGLSRSRLPDFASYAGIRLNEVIAEVDNGATCQLADLAAGLNLAIETPGSAPLPTIAPAAPQLKSRKLESRLMMLIGAGFGLGVALTLSKLLANLAPGLTIAGAVASATVGLGLAVWVTGMRGLLRDRGLLDRWAGDATGLAQSAAEQLVATRVLAAESALTGALGEQDEGESTRVSEQVNAIDSELREHSAVGDRAAALRGREMPTLLAALDALRAELGEPPMPAANASDDAVVECGDPPSEDADSDEIDEKPPENTADNVL